MHLEFEEHIGLPAREVYAYFRTPADWVRLYGAFGEVEDRGDGWHAVRLKSFPWPLEAKIVSDVPDSLVHWRFRGFWRGEGQVRLTPEPGGVVVAGFESIRPAGLSFLAPLAERLFLEKRFRAIWALGFRRLRKQAARAQAREEHGAQREVLA
jgi:hypothetical protein